MPSAEMYMLRHKKKKTTYSLVHVVHVRENMNVSVTILSWMRYTILQGKC